MSTSTDIVVSGEDKLVSELAEFKDKWWWFLILGALMILGGIIAIAYPLLSSVSVVIVLGSLLFIAGVAMLISAFWTRNWSAFLIQLLIGILYVVLGLLTMEAPVQVTGALTLMLAAVFIVSGIFRMVAAIAMQFPEWGWVMLGGALSLILGVMVYKQFPERSLVLIGLLFGIDLILTGVTWIMLAIDVRKINFKKLD